MTDPRKREVKNLLDFRKVLQAQAQFEECLRPCPVLRLMEVRISLNFLLRLAKLQEHLIDLRF